VTDALKLNGLALFLIVLLAGATSRLWMEDDRFGNCDACAELAWPDPY
jgi:hypothetical protein